MSMQGMAPRTHRMGRRLDDYKCILFDGAADYIAANGAASVINFNNDPHTISVWFKLAPTGVTYSALWSFTNSSHSRSRYWMAISAAGAVTIWGWGNTANFPIGSGGAAVTAGSNLDDGAWHNVVVTYDGSTDLKVYIDNGSPSSFAVSAGTITSDIFTIGARLLGGAAGTDYEGNVNIFQLGIYERELSAADVGNIYNYYGPGKGMNEKNFTAVPPKHYYRFGDGDSLMVTQSPGVLKDYGTNSSAADGTEYNMDTDPASGSFVVKDDRP